MAASPFVLGSGQGALFPELSRMCITMPGGGLHSHQDSVLAWGLREDSGPSG